MQNFLKANPDFQYTHMLAQVVGCFSFHAAEWLLARDKQTQVKFTQNVCQQYGFKSYSCSCLSHLDPFLAENEVAGYFPKDILSWFLGIFLS